MTTRSLDPLRKVLTREAALDWRRRSGRVVFTNGVFDLLHPGHVDILTASRARGDALVVGVNTDASVKRLKGPSRPVRSERERVHVLAALEVVDYVIAFDDDTPIPLLEAIRPGVLVKGEEYRDGIVVGREIVESNGGRIAFVSQMPGFSTTSILAKRDGS